MEHLPKVNIAEEYFRSSPVPRLPKTFYLRSTEQRNNDGLAFRESKDPINHFLRQIFSEAIPRICLVFLGRSKTTSDFSEGEFLQSGKILFFLLITIWGHDIRLPNSLLPSLGQVFDGPESLSHQRKPTMKKVLLSALRQPTPSLLAFSLFFLGCGRDLDQHSDGQFQVGGATQFECMKNGFPDFQCWAGNAGHEVITRTGVAYANEMVKRLQENKVFPIAQLPIKEKLDGSGRDSEHPYIRGNFATDKPDIISEFGPALKEFQQVEFGVPQSQSWHEGGGRQKFHALRDYKADTTDAKDLDTNLEACHKLRGVIEKNSKYSLLAYGKSTGNGIYARQVPLMKEGQLFIGTTLHTIQDSFSQAHVKRENQSGTFAPVEFCKFGSKEVPGVCHHQISDAVHGHDVVWNQGLVSAPWAVKTLTNDALLAARTSGYYLLHLHKVGTGLSKESDVEINDFLSGSPKLKTQIKSSGSARQYSSGSFDCSLLK